MEANFRRADLTYEAIFSALTFDLPGLGAALLKSLYENINPQFPITAADMRVLGGSSLSDVRVQVDMFNGLGLIDVTADKLSMNFRSLQNDGDLTICKNCISLSEQAVRSALPNLQVDAVALRPTLFLALDRKVESASSHIAQVVGSAAQFNLDEFGKPCSTPRCESRSREHRGRLECDLQRLSGSGGPVFANCFVSCTISRGWDHSWTGRAR